MERDEFLRRVEAKAKSRAEIARTLKLAPARITEMYKGERGLSYDEAVTLSRKYGIEDKSVSAERLTPVLGLLLRHQPPGGWTDRAAERLAQEIEYVLELLKGFDAKQASQDLLDLAERVVVDRLQNNNAPRAS